MSGDKETRIIKLVRALGLLEQALPTKSREGEFYEAPLVLSAIDLVRKKIVENEMGYRND